MTDDDILALTATGALAAMHARTLDAVTYASALLRHAQRREPVVHAWQHLDADHVLAQARAADARATQGRFLPLHGLPVGIKDVFLTEDLPTQYGSPLFHGSHPQLDAAAVTLLRQAGAIVFGKTHTVEFASTGTAPPTRNPRDPTRTPGGSSSGSACAVADAHVPLALGTQTGGSLIRPASFCGVTALKPTWGTVSRDGLRGFSPTLDTVGWFGRCVDDLVLMLDVMATYPGRMAGSTAPGKRPCRGGARSGHGR